MRSLVLIVVTAVLLGGGFFAYLWLGGGANLARPPGAQGESDQHAAPLAPVTRPSTRGTVVGAAADVWIERRDEETGEIASRFRAAHFDPQPDKTVVLVDQPEAEFMLDGGRVLRVRGRRGRVVMPEPVAPEQEDPLASADPRQPPRRGQLEDVTIALLPDSSREAEPQLTVALPNAAFDNDTFRIATEEYTDATGRFVAADEVPVTVRGRDYDFFGRGLVVRWNERDAALQLLEVAHGESLTIKNAAAFSLGGASDLPASAPTTLAVPSTMEAAAPLPEPRRPRQRKRKAVTQPAAPAEVPANAPSPIYRASFERDISILEEDEPVATASEMHIDFRLEEDLAGAEPNAAAPAARKEKQHRRPPATTPATAPITPMRPLTVRWQGKLRIVPLDEPSEPLPEGAALTLTGAPLTLRREGMSIESAMLRYQTDSGALRLDSSPATPQVTLRDASGTVVTTPRLDFLGEAAELAGPGRAETVPQDNRGEQIVTTWSRRCVAHFRSNEAGQRAIESADFEGDVSVAHPRLDLSSQQLGLNFGTGGDAPATGGLRLASVTAAVNVDCRLKGTAGDTQAIRCDRLTLETADDGAGSIYPHVIRADGQVVAAGEGESLSAESLRVTLRPASTAVREEMEVELEHLVARGDVRLDGRDGQSAKAQDIEVVAAAEGSAEVTLTTGAWVSDGQSTLSGPIIQFRPARGLVEVFGPGSLDTTRETLDQPARPLHVEWAGRATLDSDNDVIDVYDGVRVVATDGSEADTTLGANHLRLMLAPAIAPTTSDSESAAHAADQPATRPAFAIRGLANTSSFLEGREPKSASMDGDVTLDSIVLAGDDVLQRVFLSAAKIEHDLASQRTTVPGPGRLLVEDHRPTTRPAEDQSITFSGRGATAFRWGRDLEYDAEGDRVTMRGDVLIRHKPDSSAEPGFEIETQRVIAELAEAPATTQQSLPATGSAGAAALESLMADGGVTVRSQRVGIEAPRVRFDARSGVLEAAGSDADPIRFSDEQGASEGSARTVRWNAATDELELEGFRGRSR